MDAPAVNAQKYFWLLNNLQISSLLIRLASLLIRLASHLGGLSSSAQGSTESQNPQVVNGLVAKLNDVSAAFCSVFDRR
jgi:hypothetical protein